MEPRVLATKGMVVTPHHLATQSAIAILREGGTAMEAMVAAAATVAVVYPHMNSIGGDGYWLIVPPEGEPVVIQAIGAAGSLATCEMYNGYEKIPYKGPKSAITVAGTVGGWQEALKYVSECGYQVMSTTRLLEDAIKYAEDGFHVTSSQDISNKNIEKEHCNSEFNDVFFPEQRFPKVGEILKQKQLAKTLKILAKNGLNDFYHGEVAKSIIEDIEALEIPITASDFKNYHPIRTACLKLRHRYGELYNVPPPSMGLVSLSILGILDELNVEEKHEAQFIHLSVEATKQALGLRDHYICDPDYMTIEAQSLLSKENISKMAKKVNLENASSYNKGKGPGDTIWMGIMDQRGFSVSFIQSIYHCFGSGILLPKTGILWHNRGVSFSLKENDLHCLKPGKKPLHTLNPAAAKLNDGRVMVYGTRGGDGQPQTQATIFNRYVIQNIQLQHAVSMPRWIYGRLSGEFTDTLTIENRFSEEIVKYLEDRGHKVKLISAYSENVGQAGALVRYPDGTLEGAFDPRSNGSVAGF